MSTSLDELFPQFNRILKEYRLDRIEIVHDFEDLEEFLIQVNQACELFYKNKLDESSSKNTKVLVYPHKLKKANLVLYRQMKAHLKEVREWQQSLSSSSSSSPQQQQQEQSLSQAVLSRGGSQSAASDIHNYTRVSRLPLEEVDAHRAWLRTIGKDDYKIKQRFPCLNKLYNKCRFKMEYLWNANCDVIRLYNYNSDDTPPVQYNNHMKKDENQETISPEVLKPPPYSSTPKKSLFKRLLFG